MHHALAITHESFSRHVSFASQMIFNETIMGELGLLDGDVIMVIDA